LHFSIPATNREKKVRFKKQEVPKNMYVKDSYGKDYKEVVGHDGSHL
jgi:hypothetical protein